jgi:hypothetical protein
MRGFGLLFLGVIILGLSGCSADNESDAAKLNKSAGAAPAGEGSGQANPQKPINSMDEYAKSKQGYAPYAGTKLDVTKSAGTKNDATKKQ